MSTLIRRLQELVQGALRRAADPAEQRPRAAPPGFSDQPDLQVLPAFDGLRAIGAPVISVRKMIGAPATWEPYFIPHDGHPTPLLNGWWPRRWREVLRRDASCAMSTGSHAHAQPAQADGGGRAPRRRRRWCFPAGRELPDDRPLVIDWLQRAAERRPQRDLPRPAPRARMRAWQRLTYAEAWAKTGAVASWLIAQGYGPDRPRRRSCRTTAWRTRCSCSARCGRACWWRRSRPTIRSSGDFARLDHALDARAAGAGVRAGLVAYGKALDRARRGARHRHRRWQGRGLPFGALATARSMRRWPSGGCTSGRHAGQDPVHVGLDRHGQGRAQHARQSRVRDRDDPHGRRAARRPIASACRSTGCRGITPGAATPTSTAPSASPALFI